RFCNHISIENGVIEVSPEWGNDFNRPLCIFGFPESSGLLKASRCAIARSPTNLAPLRISSRKFGEPDRVANPRITLEIADADFDTRVRFRPVNFDLAEILTVVGPVREPETIFGGRAA